MKRILLAAAFTTTALFSNKQAQAQFPYNISKQSQTYSHLSGATSVSKGSLWTSDTTFELPVGFNVKLAGVTTNKIYLSAGHVVSATINTPKLSGFLMVGSSLGDRGKNWMSARSDVRYTTTGSAGSKIFKMEVYNAGFEDEYLNNGEMKDSISFQLWLYEGTNVVEFRYGSSMVSNFGDYFGPAMTTGYIKNVDTATGAFEKYYVLKGAPNAPTLDSITNITQPKGLSAVPASGTVFRFTPKGNTTTSVDRNATVSLAKVYPTASATTIQIEHNNAQQLNYTIVGATGQVALQGTTSGNKSSIDISGLATGAYVLRLADETTQTYEGQRIIKL